MNRKELIELNSTNADERLFLRKSIKKSVNQLSLSDLRLVNLAINSRLQEKENEKTNIKV